METLDGQVGMSWLSASYSTCHGLWDAAPLSMGRSDSSMEEKLVANYLAPRAWSHPATGQPSQGTTISVHTA